MATAAAVHGGARRRIDPWRATQDVARRPPPFAAIRRPALVRALVAPDCPPVVLLVAPAGYGKTSLLSEWAAHDARPFAWLRLDERDNDAGRMLASIANALDAAVGDDDAAPYVLVLDGLEAVEEPGAVGVLRALARDLPAQATLALASRREPPLPLARMRAARELAELGPGDLAMTRAEAGALLKSAGHELDRDAVDLLVQRTEGWPVGLALAARFLADGRTAGDLRRFDGADRLVARYVHDEILAGLPAPARELLLRSAVAGPLTGPLCDALLGRAGSAALLARLAADGLLVRLDRTDERFRHHRLLAGALLAELRRSDPDSAPLLHRRASAWSRDAGDVERAVSHALAAGDLAAAGDIVWTSVPETVAGGRMADLERRLRSFAPAELARDPSLALAAGVRDLALGQGHLVEHWMAAAGRVDPADPRRGAVEVGSALARAVLGRGGPDAMAADAGLAGRSLPADGAVRALVDLMAGVAARGRGEPRAAAERFEHGARGSAVTAPHLHAVCLALLAVTALERDDWEGAAALVTRARAQVDRHGLARYGTSALVHAASAAVRARRGRTEEALGDLREATRLQHELDDFAPWYGAEVDLLVARAAIRLSDVPLAREHLAAAERAAERQSDAGGLRAGVRAVRAELERCTAAPGSPSSPMTAAELRILAFLPTHLSFREIGERTFVSANTVKTQANAVYRKLDASCRSDAVTRARACGLLDR